MATRVLAIFPDMNTTTVEQFRGRWDPPGAVAPAHITAVFPFEWPGPASTLATVLAAQPPFPVELTEPAIWEDEYLFLLLGKGRKQVQRLHESIYGLALPGLRRPARFVPHLTVGRDRQRAALSAVRETNELSLPLVGMARSLSIYRREADGRRTCELDLPFGAA